MMPLGNIAAAIAGKHRRTRSVEVHHLMKSLLVAGLTLIGAAATTLSPPVNPNGTRPTRLSNVSVTSLSATQMRITGHYETAIGALPIAGMQVTIWSTGAASFSSWSTGYTDNNGNFSITCPKTPVGDKIQVEVQGNGAYSRPYPTYNRP
jgi:hypothetical protein